MHPSDQMLAEDWECRRKTRYDTIEQAEAMRQEYLAKMPYKKLHCYRCRFCEKWHVGRGK